MGGGGEEGREGVGDFLQALPGLWTWARTWADAPYTTVYER